MKFNSYLLPLAATTKLAMSHATIHAAWINGVDQGLGNSPSGYIRSPPNNNPLTDVNTPDLTCNVNGRNAVARTLDVKAGDQFSFEWHHQSRDANDEIIASTHKGPVLVYMAKTDAGTAGTNWVKIAEDGYDASSKKWAVDKLRENRGIHYVKIPDVQAGTYLLRGEIIALHEADRRGGAQFYMECVQIRVTSSGTSALPAGVSLPGDYKADHPGIHFNLYSGFTSYTIPGPAVWNGQSGSGDNPTQPPTQPPNTGTAQMYDQCGGANWTGPTKCAAGSTCRYQNPYYSQCLA